MTATAPLTADFLTAQFTATDELVWLSATPDEFWSLIELPEFKIEYCNNQIVGTMSYAALSHETIINNLSWLFNSHLDRSTHRCFGSNRPVFVAECADIFEPDLHIVTGDLQLYHYKKTKTASRNPSVIVEVLSPSTRNFDYNNKLPCYKTMPSVQHIVFIDQNKPHIEVFSRTKKPNEWLDSDFKNLDERVRILGKYFSLKNIYDKVIFNLT